jgi:Fic family protein
MKRLEKWIWQRADWPMFRWDAEKILPLISQARLKQGKLLSKMSSIGFDLMRETCAEVLTEETVKTAEIEGESLNRDSVRSSVAKHLGLSTFGMPQPNRSIEGLVSVLFDATSQYDLKLSADRLKSWQAALFPTGYSGLLKIEVGEWRSSSEPMQVISGALGREVVHFEAPPGPSIADEMEKFLDWWNHHHLPDGLIRAGIAHFYFVTIHPFEDGNGRIARALTDMALAQDEKSQMRFYSLSAQIVKERSGYYQILEKCQRGDCNLTDWLAWYLTCYIRALDNSVTLISHTLAKADFWCRFSSTILNEKQRKVINLLLDAGKDCFEGGLTTRKYVSIAKVSRATAFREISDLLEKGLLLKNPSKGRNISYDLNWPDSML